MQLIIRLSRPNELHKWLVYTFAWLNGMQYHHSKWSSHNWWIILQNQLIYTNFFHWLRWIRAENRLIFIRNLSKKERKSVTKTDIFYVYIQLVYVYIRYIFSCWTANRAAFNLFKYSKCIHVTGSMNDVRHETVITSFSTIFVNKFFNFIWMQAIQLIERNCMQNVTEFLIEKTSSQFFEMNEGKMGDMKIVISRCDFQTYLLLGVIKLPIRESCKCLDFGYSRIIFDGVLVFNFVDFLKMKFNWWEENRKWKIVNFNSVKVPCRMAKNAMFIFPSRETSKIKFSCVETFE